MEKLGFDPGALLEKPDGTELLEATLERTDAGRIVLCLMGDEGDWIASVTLRPDFLDTVLAQARTSEAAA